MAIGETRTRLSFKNMEQQSYEPGSEGLFSSNFSGKLALLKKYSLINSPLASTNLWNLAVYILCFKEIHAVITFPAIILYPLSMFT